MTGKQVQGIYAALLTPRHQDNRVDPAATSRLVEFLVQNGIRSYALNGATGEFCLTTPADLRALFRAVRDTAGDSVDLLCGVGSAGLAGSIELAHIAQEEGAGALLVPTPYFFPYQQDDVEAFFQAIASSVSLPIMLYNLPQFTTGLTVETACTLIRDVPNIIGIKDSSGSLDILRALTQQGIPACRIIGNDGALVAALEEGLCDGVVSGVACVLPELIQSVYSDQRCDQVRLLDEFIARIDVFPTPWALKWIAEARGILQASFAQPVSLRRSSQCASLKSWFQDWQASIPSHLATK
jgi:4-hydroxy-tetrahydrodipicolinate synthase